MRSLETLILLLTAGSALMILRGSISRRHFMQFLFLVVLLTLLHLTWEGYRWQMIPAYFLLGFLFIRIKARKLVSIDHLGKTVLVLWVAIAVVLPTLIPVPELPEPGGPYQVGTKIYQWTDSSRTEWFTEEDPNDVRKLVVQIWYPALFEDSRSPAAYIDNMELRLGPLAGAGDFPGMFIGHLGLVKSNSLIDAPINFSTAPYPVVILSHGITGMRHLHTVLIEHLVSNGYVVAAPDHPYDCNLTVFPDGTLADYRSDLTGHPDSARVRRKQLNTRTADLHFIYDKLKSMNNSSGFFHAAMDLDKVASAGHSYGGATAIQFSYSGGNIKVCIALDSWMNPVPDDIIAAGIKQPFLHLGRPRWENYPDSPTRLDTFLRQKNNYQFSYMVKGTEHLDFTDIPLLAPFSGLFLDTGKIRSERAVNLVNEFVTAFLDEFLAGREKRFQSVVSHYPEAVLK